jgi:DNA-binding MarR family transcriptional regulator
MILPTLSLFQTTGERGVTMNDKPNIDIIVDDLLTTLPLLHRAVRRNLFKGIFAKLDVSISPPHFAVMKALSEGGILTMSQIGGTLDLPRPQVTPLVDRLVDLQLADRKVDPEDRRNVLVFLTEEGQEAYERYDQMIRQSVRESLSHLANRDVAQLSAALNTMRGVLSKLE